MAATVQCEGYLLLLHVLRQDTKNRARLSFLIKGCGVQIVCACVSVLALTMGCEVLEQKSFAAVRGWVGGRGEWGGRGWSKGYLLGDEPVDPGFANSTPW